MSDFDNDVYKWAAVEVLRLADKKNEEIRCCNVGNCDTIGCGLCPFEPDDGSLRNLSDNEKINWAINIQKGHINAESLESIEIPKTNPEAKWRLAE